MTSISETDSYALALHPSQTCGPHNAAVISICAAPPSEEVRRFFCSLFIHSRRQKRLMNLGLSHTSPAHQHSDHCRSHANRRRLDSPRRLQKNEAELQTAPIYKAPGVRALSVHLTQSRAGRKLS